MKEADQTVIAVAAQTLCSVIANNVGQFTCEGPRVGGANPWLEPPDAYCTPERCWIGVKDHPDFDQERDCNDADRLCCDPTAESAELQACNAWFVKMDAVWASVTSRDTRGGEIERVTDPAQAPPRVCQ
jgi:hypothetical protein